MKLTVAILVFYTTLLGRSDGCLSLNGGIPQFASLSSPRSSGTFRSSRHILSSGLRFTCTGEVQSWQAYMERSSTYNLIVFQVWEPLSNGCSFELKGSHSVMDYTVGDDFLVDTSTVVPALPPIAVAPGDAVGVYVVSRRSTIGVQQYASDESAAFISRIDIDTTSMIDTCGSDISVVMGAPIVNAVVIEALVATSMTSHPSTVGVTTASATTPDSTSTTPSASTTPGGTVEVATTSGEEAITSTTPGIITNPGITDTTTQLPDGGTGEVATTSGEEATTVVTQRTDETTHFPGEVTDGVTTSSNNDATSNSLSIDVVGSTAGETFEERNTNANSLSYAAGSVAVVLAIILAVVFSVFSVYCFVMRRSKRVQRSHPMTQEHANYEQKTQEMHWKTDEAETTQENIYSEVGPPLLNCMQLPHKPTDPDSSLQIPTADYEVPTMQRKTQRKPPPRERKTPRQQAVRNNGKREGDLEVSNVYDTPLDAAKGRKNASTCLQDSDNYEIPMNPLFGIPTPPQGNT